jgi:hypothetical protein
LEVWKTMTSCWWGVSVLFFRLFLNVFSGMARRWLHP